MKEVFEVGLDIIKKIQETQFEKFEYNGWASPSNTVK
jgi:hypothetical protein